MLNPLPPRTLVMPDSVRRSKVVSLKIAVALPQHLRGCSGHRAPGHFRHWFETSRLPSPSGSCSPSAYPSGSPTGSMPPTDLSHATQNTSAKSILVKAAIALQVKQKCTLWDPPDLNQGPQVKLKNTCLEVYPAELCRKGFFAAFGL